ncbi:hypothetical protein ABZ614_11780 [Streptomyces sp. NPDC013178]|uniref:hypothetical protein n=1 Tax=unclassified Streptomyces TaxID=2593676 RepID=UPI0034109503
MKKCLVVAGSALVASLGVATTAPPAVAQQANTSVACGDAAGLIAAVGRANAHGGVVTLAKRCTYRFTDDFNNSGNALPLITGKVTIMGQDSALVRSSHHAAARFRLLTVATGGSLTLRSATVEGGLIIGNGGGIRNKGTLRLEHSTVAGNYATGRGGGISNEGGRATLVNSRVLTNVASKPPRFIGDGGGLNNNASGTLRLTNTTVAGNTADEDGGGILNEGRLIVEGSRIANNEAREDDGGGINTYGHATIRDSTITENWAAMEGGGLANSEDGTVDVQRTSFVSNQAGHDAGAFNNEGTATLKNSKVLRNRAGRNGGGLNNEQEPQTDTARLTLDHTTVSDNRASGRGGGIHNWPGAVVTLKGGGIKLNKPGNCSGRVPGCA